MPFLIVFFTVALGLCVVGLVVISLWWSWLFLAAIFGSVQRREIEKTRREPRGRETTDLLPPLTEPPK